MKKAPASTKEQKLAWLEQHVVSIKAASANEDTQKALFNGLAKQMKVDGLFSPLTYVGDIAHGILRLAEARGWCERRGLRR